MVFTYFSQLYFIAPLSDIPMFYIKYPTMHKVHMQGYPLFVSSN